MDLDPLLLEILACPCPRHEPVVPDHEAETIVCTFCRTTFPVRDDIPVMLLDEASPGPAGVGVAPDHRAGDPVTDSQADSARDDAAGQP